MTKSHRTKFYEELGKAMADRLGLAHDQTSIDWSADHSGGSNAVTVTMKVAKVISLDEFNELRRVADARASKDESCIHEWSPEMRIGGPLIRMCRRCNVTEEVGA